MRESGKGDLRQKTIISLVWNAFDKAGFQIIAFVIGLATLRLLSPRDFGLIGALAIFTALSNILIESGFSSAMIRRPNNQNGEYTAVLCFNFTISLLFYLVLFFCSNKIATYYQMPELADLSRFLFLSILFNSLSIVQNIILTKELEFKKLSIANICGGIFAGVVTILMIICGYTYWALAWQILLQSAIKCVLLWIFSNWRPKERPDFRIIGELFKFSSSLIFSSLANTFVRYVYNPIIGRKFGEEQLGYYAEAYKFYYLPSNIISGTISGVAYPVLSKLNDEARRQMTYLRKMVRMTAFGIFPILFAAMACFDNLVSVVLTEKWMPIVSYFRILAIAGLVTPFHTLYLSIVTMKGYPQRNFAMECIRNIFILTPIFFLTGNIEWMLWSFTFANIASYVADLFFIKKILPYTILEQIKDIAPYMVVSIVMATGIYLINFTAIDIRLQLVIPIIFGIVSYIGGCYLLKSRILLEMIQNIRQKL